MPNTKTMLKNQERERVNGVKIFKLKNLSKILLISLFVMGGFLFSGTGQANAATFTSVTSGNWNNGATWGNVSPGVQGVDFPSESGGDIFNVSQNTTVTIPTGYSAKASGIIVAGSSLSSRTRVVINGTMTLDGTLTCNANIDLTIGAGGTLDLNNKTIALNGDTGFYLNGSSSSRATLKSIVSGGVFTSTVTTNIDINWSYADLSGIGSSTIGNGTTASQNIIISHVTVNNCGDLKILNGSINAGSSFILEYSDFRNPTGTNKFFLSAYLGTATPTGTRTVRHCTFDGGATSGTLVTRSPNFILDDIVFVKSNWMPHGISGQLCRNIFHYDNTEVNGAFFNKSGLTASNSVTIDKTYIYMTASNPHPIDTGATGSMVVSNSVFESLSQESNTILEQTGNISVFGNINIGGNLYVRHYAAGATTTSVYNNTAYGSNTSQDIAHSLLMQAESGDVISGTCTVKNNIIYNPNSTYHQYGIGLYENIADQIDSTDYNAWFANPSGDIYDHYYGVSITGKNEGDSGFGGHDIIADPNFMDSSRNLAKWNASLGGPGTAGDAISMLLKMNGYGGTSDPNYTPNNIINYVQTGFTPTNMTLATAGESGTYIGAVPPVDTTAPSISAFSIPATSTSRTVSVTLTATDDSGTVSGYCLTETNDSSSCSSWSGSTAPTSYTFDTDGAKTLYAFAKDAVPNISTTSAGSTATTIIDSTAPILSFTNDVAAGPVNADTITVSWGDATIKKWDYDLDSTCSTTSGDYTKTDSDSLGQTTQTNNTKYICLYAEDSSGNYSTLASTNPINIDITSPTTTINSHPDSATTSTTATFTFTANETATFQCKIDSESYATCTTPKSYTSLTEGEHTFSVKAVDTATNEDATPETFTWTIDSQLPTLSNLAPNNETLPATTTSTNLTLNTNESAICKYATTSTDFSSMTQFDSTASTSHSTLITGLNPNTTYTYYIKCQDNATNVSTEAQLSFSVAAVSDEAPIIEKIEIKINRTINKFKDTIRTAENKLKFQQEDTNLANGEVKIYKGKSLWKTITVDAQGAWSQLLKFKDDFSGTVKIKQYDQDGDLLSTDKANIKIDTEKPVFTEPFLTTVTAQFINFKATDNDEVSYYKVKLLDNQGHTVRSWKKQTKSSYTIPTNIIDQAKTIIVRAYDRVGNYTEEQANIQLGKSSGLPANSTNNSQSNTKAENSQPSSEPLRPDDYVATPPQQPHPSLPLITGEGENNGEGAMPAQPTKTSHWWNPLSWF